MDLQLAGKTALVTGSTAGIGLAIASSLAAEGAHVTVNGRTRGRVEQAIAQIRKAHPDAKVTGFDADVSNSAGCEKLAAALPQVDILVNNAGIFEPKPFVEIPDQDWERFFQTNVMSGVRLSRSYLPKMLKQNWGRIVFISSESGLQIPVEMIHYGMTKTAQLAISRGLAEATIGTNVTVNAILPGPTASEGVTTFVSALAKEQKVRRKNSKNNSSSTPALHPCCNDSPPPRKSPTSSHSFAARSPPPPTGRPCASMAESSAP